MNQSILTIIRPLMHTKSIALEFEKGLPLSEVLLDKSDFEDIYGGRRLPGLLRSIGSMQIATRVLVCVEEQLCQVVNDRLISICQNDELYDPAWIFCPAVSISDSGASKEAAAFLLTPDQARQVLSFYPHPRAHGKKLRYVLPNFQVLTETSTFHDIKDRNMTIELQPIEYFSSNDIIKEAHVQKHPDRLLLQASPSSPFADRLGSTHLYAAVLNPIHKAKLGSGFVSIWNPLLPLRRGAIDLSLPLVIAYDNRVQQGCAVLDETTAVAIGLRPGEYVEVEQVRDRRARIERYFLGFRHSICRVSAPNMTDIEKPVVRIGESVLDLLGTSSGDRVIVEANRTEQDPYSVSRMSIRGLVSRDIRPPIHGGYIDIYDQVGSVDIPSIEMDLNSRRRLGISRGSPVYVRPSFSSIASKSFTTLSLSLLAAVVSSVAGKQYALAATVSAIYLLLAGYLLLREFR